MNFVKHLFNNYRILYVTGFDFFLYNSIGPGIWKSTEMKKNNIRTWFFPYKNLDNLQKPSFDILTVEVHICMEPKFHNLHCQYFFVHLTCFKHRICQLYQGGNWEQFFVYGKKKYSNTAFNHRSRSNVYSSSTTSNNCTTSGAKMHVNLTFPNSFATFIQSSLFDTTSNCGLTIKLTCTVINRHFLVLTSY